MNKKMIICVIIAIVAIIVFHCNGIFNRFDIALAIVLVSLIAMLTFVLTDKNKQ